MDEKYYRVLVNEGMNVVCMEEFDEKDYNQSFFGRDKNYNKLKFKTEDEAKLYIRSVSVMVIYREEVYGKIKRNYRDSNLDVLDVYYSLTREMYVVKLYNRERRVCIEDIFRIEDIDNMK